MTKVTTTSTRHDSRCHLRDVEPRPAIFRSWERARHRRAQWLVECVAEMVSPPRSVNRAFVLTTCSSVFFATVMQVRPTSQRNNSGIDNSPSGVGATAALIVGRILQLDGAGCTSIRSERVILARDT